MGILENTVLRTSAIWGVCRDNLALIPLGVAYDLAMATLTLRSILLVQFAGGRMAVYGHKRGLGSVALGCGRLTLLSVDSPLDRNF
jgi:hypothetical protein